MKLNRMERWLMNNPIRSAMQRHEAEILEQIGGKLVGERVLEIGCGRGIGIEVLVERFGAAEVHAIDVDARMAGLAQHRVRVQRWNASVVVADAVAIPLRSGSVDAVIDFGAIHHVTNWRAAISEIVRVLRPGGRFYFMEITKQSLDRWVVRRLLDHPREDRFDAGAFRAELEGRGVRLVGGIATRWGGDMILGVGRRAAEVMAGPS